MFVFFPAPVPIAVCVPPLSSAGKESMTSSTSQSALVQFILSALSHMWPVRDKACFTLSCSAMNAGSKKGTVKQYFSYYYCSIFLASVPAYQTCCSFSLHKS